MSTPNETFTVNRTVELSEFEVRVTSTDALPSMEISAKVEIIVVRTDTNTVVSRSSPGRVVLTDAEVRGSPQFEAFRAALRAGLLAKAMVQYSIQ